MNTFIARALSVQAADDSIPKGSKVEFKGPSSEGGKLQGVTTSELYKAEDGRMGYDVKVGKTKYFIFKRSCKLVKE